MLRAFIFDFDGVIVNSEPVHFSAFQRVLAEEGIHMTWEQYQASYLAMNDRDCFAVALARAGQDAGEDRLHALAERKSDYYEAIRDQVQPVPGVQRFIRRAAERAPVALGSGGLRRDIEPILARLGLREAFSAVVTAEDYQLGKPDPQCFRVALAQLNDARGTSIAPEECLVIEDSLHGITAARGAGMRCLAIATYYPPARLAGADRVVRTLEEVDPGDLAPLFAEGR